MKKLLLICAAVAPIVLSPSLQARTIDTESKLDSSLGSAASSSSDQILINRSTRFQSGIWNQRRQKKSWPSARIAPRKPRKKLNPDSMAQNALS